MKKEKIIGGIGYEQPKGIKLLVAKFWRLHFKLSIKYFEVCNCLKALPKKVAKKAMYTKNLILNKRDVFGYIIGDER